MNRMRLVVNALVLAITFLVAPEFAIAQASLENPQPGSYQSGIGILSGWSCQSQVSIVIDGALYSPAYGTARADAASICGGNANVGFGLLFNFNILGPGTHSAQLRVGGAPVGAAASFTVTVPVGEFAQGLARTISVPDFPVAGKTTQLVWQQSQQNFAISAVTGNASIGGFPISINSMQLTGMTFATDVFLGQTVCNATLSYRNTANFSISALLNFDVLQGGVIKGRIPFQTTLVAAGASSATTQPVLIGLAAPACGTFTLQFNAANSSSG